MRAQFLRSSTAHIPEPTFPTSPQPIPSDDPRKRKPDITKAKQHLNWEPAVPLEEGLTLTIDDFTQRLAQQ